MKRVSKQFLKGKKVLITAGPTREYLDPVRYISNDSSGKTGYELAKAAKSFGAKVTLISGPTNLARPKTVKFIPVISAKEMFKAALKEFKDSDITVCAAAIADFRPASVSRSKIKKTNSKNQKLKISLIKNPDILKSLGKIKKTGQILIGFALETENLKRNALNKLRSKHCDAILANTPKNIGADGGEFYVITDRRMKPKLVKSKNKSDLAAAILTYLFPAGVPTGRKGISSTRSRSFR